MSTKRSTVGQLNNDFLTTFSFAALIVNLCNAHHQVFREDIEEQYTVSCVVLAFCRDSCRDVFSLPLLSPFFCVKVIITQIAKREKYDSM